MKKRIITLLIILLLVLSLGLVGCDETSNKVVVDTLISIITTNPQVYKIDTTIDVGGLHSVTTLKIGKVEKLYNAEYSYAIEKYLPITDGSTSQKETITDKKYFTGTELADELKINWETGSPIEGIVPSALGLTYDSLKDESITYIDGLFKAEYKATETESSLGIAGITTASIEIKAQDNKIVYIKIIYTKAEVVTTINVSYGYEIQTVTIPSV
ncbi:MAG: hypothetical protein RR086_01835 [Clostridia bacterium]